MATAGSHARSARLRSSESTEAPRVPRHGQAPPGPALRTFGTIAAVAVLGTASGMAVADEYSWQVSAGGQRLEIGDTVEADRVALEGRYYFPPADDGNGPYALAAFLSRSSHAGIAVHRDDEVTTTTFSSPTIGTVTNVSETESKVWSVSGRYVLPGSGWYAGGSYHAGDADPPPSQIAVRSIDIEGYSVGFGKYLGAATTIGLAWDSTERETQFSDSVCAFPICLPVGKQALTVEEASLRAMHVGTVGGLTWSVAANVASRRADIELAPAPRVELSPRPGVPPFDFVVRYPGAIVAPPTPSTPAIGRSRRYAGAFEVFPTASLGIRAGYARWDGNRAIDDTYEVSVDWFFVRNVNARLGFVRTNHDTPVEEWSETDTISLTLGGRF